MINKEKSVEDLLESDTELEKSMTDYFSETCEALTEEQKKRIIEKGIKKLDAAASEHPEEFQNEKADIYSDTEKADVIRNPQIRLSWIRSAAAAAACIGIAGGIVWFAGRGLQKNDRIELAMPEQTEFTAPAETECAETEAESVTESPAVIFTAENTECTSVSVTEAYTAETEIRETSVQAPVNTDVPVNSDDRTKDTYTEKENTGNGIYRLDGSVLNISPGIKSVNQNDFPPQLRGTVTAVVIPDSVTEISDYAFAEFSNLNEISLPDSVESIGKYAFVNCTSLRTINLPASLKELGTCMFNGCTIDYIGINSGNLHCSNASSTGGGTVPLKFGTVEITDRAGSLGDDFLLPVLNAEVLRISKTAAETLKSGMTEDAVLNTLEIGKGTEKLQDEALSHISAEHLILPAELSSPGKRVLAYSIIGTLTVLNPELDPAVFLDTEDNDAAVISAIEGYSGSSAERYADSHGINFLKIN